MGRSWCVPVSPGLLVTRRLPLASFSAQPCTPHQNMGFLPNYGPMRFRPIMGPYAVYQIMGSVLVCVVVFCASLPFKLWPIEASRWSVSWFGVLCRNAPDPVYARIPLHIACWAGELNRNEMQLWVCSFMGHLRSGCLVIKGCACSVLPIAYHYMYRYIRPKTLAAW